MADKFNIGDEIYVNNQAEKRATLTKVISIDKNIVVTENGKYDLNDKNITLSKNVTIKLSKTSQKYIVDAMLKVAKRRVEE